MNKPDPITLALQSLRRNRPMIDAALRSGGYQGAWFDGVERGLERAQKERAELIAACKAALERLEASHPPANCATDLVCKQLMSAIDQAEGKS